MNADVPFLSIVIATYRRPQQLRTMLESIYAQWPTDQSVEVVVVDNGLDDATPAMMAESKTSFPRLEYVRRAASVPMEESIMAAREYGRGEYIWVLGDDDSLYNGCIPRMLAYLRAHQPEVLLLRHDAWTSDLSRHIVSMHNFLPDGEVPFPSLMEAARQLGWGVYFAYLGCIVFKPQAFRRVDITPYVRSPHVFAMTLLEAYGTLPCVYLREKAIRYRVNSTLPYSETGLRVVTTLFLECFSAAVKRGWGDWKMFLNMREAIASDHKLLYLRVHTLASCMLSNLWDRIKLAHTITDEEWVLFDEGYSAYADADMLQLLALLRTADTDQQQEVDAVNLLLGRILMKENLNRAEFPRDFLLACTESPRNEHLVT